MKVNLLEKLLATQPKVGEITFIAADGHGGSGKSTLAKILAEYSMHKSFIRTILRAGITP